MICKIMISQKFMWNNTMISTCGPGKFTIWPKLYPSPWPVPRRSLAEDE